MPITLLLIMPILELYECWLTLARVGPYYAIPWIPGKELQSKLKTWFNQRIKHLTTKTAYKAESIQRKQKYSKQTGADPVEAVETADGASEDDAFFADASN